MIRYTPAVRSTTTPLTLEQVRSAAPSIFSTRPHSKMSERYAFVSTAKLIEPLLKDGFTLSSARQRAASARDPKFTRHELRLRPENVKPMVGDTFPEVIISNSHDGQSRLVLRGGLYRLVCSNGLVTGVAAVSLAERHVGDRNAIIEAALQVVSKTSSLRKIVESMTKVTLTDKQQASFAIEAAKLAYEGQPSFDPQLLLGSRREADTATNVWAVYNRVQENLIRGGIQFQTPQGRRVTTRGISHIGRSNELNVGLWDLAEKLAA
jgi:hypothetical protein